MKGAVLVKMLREVYDRFSDTYLITNNFRLDSQPEKYVSREEIEARKQALKIRKSPPCLRPTISEKILKYF